MLEQQWPDPKRPRILQVSNGFSYTWDATKPFGERMIAERMTLERQADRSRQRLPRHRERLPRRSAATASRSLKEGTAPQFGGYDADALYAYFKANSPIGPLPPTASCA